MRYNQVIDVLRFYEKGEAPIENIKKKMAVFAWAQRQLKKIEKNKHLA